MPVRERLQALKLVHLRRVALGLAGVAALLAVLAVAGVLMRFAPLLLVFGLVALTAYPIGMVIEEEMSARRG